MKAEKSALSNAAFRSWILSEEDRGATHFFVCGFLLEHCVLDTALDLRASLSSTNHVVVLSDLVASRASKYSPNGVVAQTFGRLKDASVEIYSSDKLLEEM
jgi:nicotinamidase-related amidase